jgi:hypothetical protein
MTNENEREITTALAALVADDAETARQVAELDELEQAKTTPPPPPATHLTETEFWKLRFLAEHAEKLDAQVSLLREQLMRVVLEQRQTQEDYSTFQRILAEKYGLEPADQIVAKGEIVRAAPPASSMQNGKD